MSAAAPTAADLAAALPDVMASAIIVSGDWDTWHALVDAIGRAEAWEVLRTAVASRTGLSRGEALSEAHRIVEDAKERSDEL